MKNMINLSIMFAAALVVFLAPVPAGAEFYKYRDQNGVMRFTDNLGEVPVDQRPKVESYAEPEDFVKSDPKHRRAAAEASRKRPAKVRLERTQPDEAVMVETAEQRAARFMERKSALDAEYDDIMADRKALSKERKALGSPASYKAYNREQTRLNERAEAYEKKRRRFEEQMEADNPAVPGKSLSTN